MFPYTLGELHQLLPKGTPPSRRLTGIGRNCDLFRSMVSEVFRPRWAPILGAQGWSEAWLDHVRDQNVAMFAPEGLLPGLGVPVDRQELFPVLDSLKYDPGRFSALQRARNGLRWHDNPNFDFDRQATDVRELKGMKQSTVAKAMGLSQARVSQIRSGTGITVMGLIFCPRGD